MTAPARGLSACHNHTQMSDGALALDDMVRAAVRQGFSDIGISDHSCLAAEPPHATGDEAGYLAALRGAKARFSGQICVAAGLELDALSHFSARHELDYVIGSVHYLYDKAADRFYGVDWDEATAQSCIKEMFGQNGLAYAKAYYAAVAENALRTRPDVIGHFDLVVKPNARGALFDEESPAYRAAALEALELSEYREQHPAALSGGQKQRVAIDRGLMRNPVVLLADEPVASLDPVTGRQILQLLRQIQRSRGVSVLMNSHNLDLSLEFSTHIVGMNRGRVVFDGAPGDVTEAVLRDIYGEAAAV